MTEKDEKSTNQNGRKADPLGYHYTGEYISEGEGYISTVGIAGKLRLPLERGFLFLYLPAALLLIHH